MDGTSIVKRIKSLLIKNGKTMQDLIRDCKISGAAISQWNTGRTTPRMRKLEEIAKYLGTDVAFLAYGVAPTEITFAFKMDGEMTDEEIESARKDMEDYWRFLMSKRS